jgi:hypothetical protein
MLKTFFEANMHNFLTVLILQLSEKIGEEGYSRDRGAFCGLGPML